MNWYKLLKLAAIPDYKKILELQKATEGMIAAIKDPKTGKIYTGFSHQSIIDNVKDNEVASRLWKEQLYDDNSGFIDKNGKFLNRNEAEKQYQILTMEDLKDLRNNKNLGRLFRGGIPGE